MRSAPVAFRFPRLDPRTALTRNVPLKLGAIAVALVVSLLAAAAAPEESGSFEGVPVERANLLEGHLLRGPLGEVEVLYRGPIDAVRDLRLSSFRAEVDLGAYDLAQDGELQELPVRVVVADPRIRVVGVRPSAVAARLVPVGSKRLVVLVRFDNQPPSGFQIAGAPQITPAAVTVHGPADALREVTAVVARMNFPDSPNDLTASPRALAVDAAGREVTEVDTDPQNVAVTVSLEPARTTRTVPVVPDVRGSPAPGYWVSSASVDPPIVTIRGDAATLEQVGALATAVIDVTGATRERTVRVPLLLPSGTSLARPTDVLVSLTVAPARGTRSFPLIAVQAQNVRADLTAELDPAGVEVVLSGEVPTLRQVSPEQIGASVDLRDRVAGSYQVDVTVRAPSGTTVASVTSGRITVTLRARQ